MSAVPEAVEAVGLTRFSKENIAMASHFRGGAKPRYSGENHPFIRSLVVGIAYGLPMGLFAPMSPFFRRAIKQNKQTVALFASATVATGFGSMLSYRLLLEPPKEKWMASYRPNLNLTNCIVPGVSGVLMGHLCYPGLFILLGERTWAKRRSEYFRMTRMTLLAFFPSHMLFVGPYCLVLGMAFRRKGQKRKEKARKKKKKAAEASGDDSQLPADSPSS